MTISIFQTTNEGNQNPPYSAGQKSANDGNANIAYPHLDETIRKSYAAHSSGMLQRALYDSYIRAIRWGSDRIGTSGVMAYVSNAGWIDGNAMDGLRKCLAEEYSSLYIFHLRGNARTSGELRRKEKDNVFGMGTRTPIAISLFVKNPKAKEHGKIYFHDIGDYLSQKEKLDIVRNFKSIEGITEQKAWKSIVPDQYNDWINHRDESFDHFIDMGDKKDKNSITIFENYSNGIKTNRDFWCYNSSKENLKKNILSTLEFYNREVDRYHSSTSGKTADVKTFIDTDPQKISWDRPEIQGVQRGRRISFDCNSLFVSSYRPFFKQWNYFNRNFNNCVYQMPQIFPKSGVENRIITVNTNWSGNGNIVLMSEVVSDLHFNGDAQCFPLKLYEKVDDDADGLFAGAASENGYRVKDGISDVGLAHFKAAYPYEKITKEDLFYYIYGLLHSEDYRARYADNLSKQLPCIPCVKNAADFWVFSKSGRALAELHVNYETVEPYPVTYKEGALFMDQLKPADFRVEKMKFGKKGKDADKSTVIYNHKITMTDIPLAAYDYVVNGKPALEWVMERQCVKTDKDSGIVNDANLFAIETVGDAAYPLKLFQRVITVSLETMKIVRGLPKLEIQEPKKKAA